MNKNKASIKNIYLMMGEMHSDIKNINLSTQEIKERLKNGDVKFDEMQKQISKNKFKINLIWSGLAVLTAGVIASLGKYIKKIIGGIL